VGGPGHASPARVGDLRLRPSTDDDLGAVLDLVQRQSLAGTGRSHPLTADRLRAKRSRPRQGVLCRGRRHGLGQALLARAFSAYAATGTTFVSLEVDEQSLTGATRVYERAGMRPRTVNVTWTRRLAPG
jgi:ribosomal protein S18 acetylase RimI-like enzyme